MAGPKVIGEVMLHLSRLPARERAAMISIILLLPRVSRPVAAQARWMLEGIMQGATDGVDTLLRMDEVVVFLESHFDEVPEDVPLALAAAD